MNKKTFVAYNGKEFNSLTEKNFYHIEEFQRMGHQIRLIECTNEDGFERINGDTYSNCLVGIRWTDDIHKLFEFIEKSVIVYCKTKEAAKLLEALLTTGELSMGKIVKGYNFFIESKLTFIPLGGFYFTSENKQNEFNKMIDVLNAFMKENI